MSEKGVKKVESWLLCDIKGNRGHVNCYHFALTITDEVKWCRLKDSLLGIDFIYKYHLKRNLINKLLRQALT